MKRDYPERPIIGVGAVIVAGDRALLVRRATEPLKGEWSVPGGVLELGEKLRDGAAREALEETGLQVEVGEVLDVFDSIFTDADGRTQYHYVLIDFLCRPLACEATAGSDVSEVKWVTESDLASTKLRDSIAQVVRKGLAAVPYRTLERARLHSLRKNSTPKGFASGHDFSCAVQALHLCHSRLFSASCCSTHLTNQHPSANDPQSSSGDRA